MLMPGRKYQAAGGLYRYGFNGKEKDSEVKGEGAQYDYGFRIYDPRIGRFLSVDPLVKNFPWWTPYQFAGNTPIQAMDLDGKEIYFYNWDQSKQGNTTLQKVYQIDVIEQRSDIVFFTDLFGWQITQKANLKDLGLEQTWILYDNNWRLVPNTKLNQSLDKISKEEWGSFLTPEKYEETLQNIKGIGDKASLAINIAMLADGFRRSWCSLISE
jgi:RHS repeat-associated protein